ncbi:MAG: YihA family ribosome biogenesis GTP-binding protein [Caedibacter sp. 38-128]|nr:YihA family ribosome biogenesis GTP-binding protein [Holosporales bacterium]OJX04786.1 MAG: YihA family ribosome biogenesis GTP-binding protein [Caedibacter sp. 38-128]
MKENSEKDVKFLSKLFGAEVQFMRGVNRLEDLPPLSLPEIAFAGRSNVGKSSLINAVLGRRDVARTSNTPGRTQEINFFNLAKSLILVDLPGYGYARESKSKIKAWNELIRLYLRGRSSLKRVFLLVDSRHGLKENDREIMEMLDEAAVSYQLILTKCDKLKPLEVEKVLGLTSQESVKHAAAFPEVLTTSSVSKNGIEFLRATIAQFA